MGHVVPEELGWSLGASAGTETSAWISPASGAKKLASAVVWVSEISGCQITLGFT